MQRDTDRTFRDIHGDRNNLAAQIMEIEKYVVEDERQSKIFPLRFVRLCNSQQSENSENNVVHLRLTPFGELDSRAEYVAVSYTWEQPAHLDELLGVNVPNYVLWISESKCRSLRCPVLVLH